MPDRLPSLVLLAGFWIPPAIAGWVAAGSLLRRPARERVRATGATLALFVVGYAAAWFAFQIHRMPPYMPGSTLDPTYATPEAVRRLLLVASALVLPGSALACWLAFRWRRAHGRRTGARSAA